MPEELEPIYLKCGTCLQYKMHNLRFENDRYRAREILEIVHTDVNGPHVTTGYDGSKYFSLLSMITVSAQYCIRLKTKQKYQSVLKIT